MESDLKTLALAAILAKYEEVYGKDARQALENTLEKPDTSELPVEIKKKLEFLLKDKDYQIGLKIIGHLIHT